MGTSGRHLEVPPSHPVKTRFNLGQVIDSAASALLIMIQEMQPSLLTTHHLQNIRGDLAKAQQELKTLRSTRHPTAPQRARWAELRRLSRHAWEAFLWGYRASGQTTGFHEAVQDFFANVGPGQPPRNMDYEFWVRTTVRWLFEKRKAVSSWAEAVRTYNGGGPRAVRYRDDVTSRVRAALAADKAGREFVPADI